MLMKTFSREGWAFGFAVVVVQLLAARAEGFNLTGEWVGTVTCQVFDGRQRSVPAVGSALKITQSGTILSVRIEDSSGVRHYNGEAIDDSAQPLRMRGVLIECRSSTSLNNYSEVVHLSGSGGYRLRGKSILRNEIGDIDTCRWTFQRITAANPAISGCP
jgi:hypothetical protein